MERRVTMFEVAGNQGDPEIKSSGEGSPENDRRNKYSVKDQSLYDSIEAREETKLESEEAQARH